MPKKKNSSSENILRPIKKLKIENATEQKNPQHDEEKIPEIIMDSNHLAGDMVRKIASYLDRDSFNRWRRTCSFFAKETFNDLKNRLKDGYKIKMIAPESHTVFLRENGTVWVCGENYHGQLGLGNNYINKHKCVNKPTPIPNLQGIQQIAASSFATFFLKKDGTVLACGDNELGQLGFDKKISKIDTPTKIPNIDNVKQIAAGFEHTVFLKKDGTVWACGNNRYGELGSGEASFDFHSLTEIPNLNDVQQVAAGGGTLFLKNDGTVCYSGFNYGGTLRLNGLLIPTPIPNLSEVQQISAYAALMFLKKDGTIWVCGSNKDGELGLGLNEFCDTPTQIPNFYGVKQFASGINHTVFLKQDGTVWVCGRNLNGQLGLGDFKYRNTPTMIPNLKASYIAAAGDNTAFITEDGRVLMCGSNYHGRLGLGFDIEVTDKICTPTPSLLKTINDLQEYHDAAQQHSAPKRPNP